ncbi:alpha-1,2-mannosidase, putative [Pilibacter termitis]|uniref:Alpha-1,2-mannosidase, putative n=1 Tax=Pilibacter termitis TaxID=263852 RepID=A0A1T4MAN9_9ENTE|nr:GH92 family glycosyl hydrolase [Pilibacter termitis]SJZ63916.1 alpha-1,2-mannosidase, putative [Pilibacter termitis]
MSVSIDTRHGSSNTASLSNGNCLPLTSTPHAMNYFAPQTSSSRGAWWFHPEDVSFEGFRLTHQPSPWVGDFGYLLLQPFSGKVSNPSVFGASSSYERTNSVFSPHELSVFLNRYEISASLTPSRYGAKLRINYERNGAGMFLHLTENHAWRAIDNHTITGWVSNFAECEDKEFKMYFALFFHEAIQETTSHALFFGDIKTQEVTLATSFISEKQVHLNLQRELEKSYEEVKENAKVEWENVFSKIKITHHNQEEKSTFYHCLYRAFLFPTRFYELDENFSAIHYQTHTKEVKKGVYYTNNGFWDTAKTVYPLYTLIAQDTLSEMLEGFLNVYREVGYLPKWLSPDERGMMPGMAIDSVIADCLTKGIRMDLAEEFLQAMIHSANVKSGDERFGRANIEAYNRLGFVPNSQTESVNQTQDNAYSDYCIAQVAELLGKTEIERKYRKLSIGYRQLIDEKTHLLRAKDENGNFVLPFSTYEWGGAYTEGSAWQNSFLAFHDIAGYIESIGGEENFSKLLSDLCNQSSFFEVGHYGFEIHEMTEMARLNFGQLALSNQPSFHVPYLFHYCHQPEKTQILVRQLLKNAFSSGEEAFPGDEDNGSMSCWYIFSSLGFFPVCCGNKEYQLGIPLFDKAEVTLSNNETLRIQTTPNEVQHQFVIGKRKNGKEYKANTLQHDEVMKGGTLEIQLGILPNEK